MRDRMGERKCKNCGYKLEKGWNYCPNCGMEIPKFYDRLSFGLDNLIEKVMADLQAMFMQSLFPSQANTNSKKIEIRIEPQSIHKKGQQKPQFPRQIPKEVKVEEAETIIHKLGKRDAEIQIKLPKTKEEDVDIVVNFESVEIRAISKNNKMYFKILEIPKNTKLVEKRLEKGVLYLRFSK